MTVTNLSKIKLYIIVYVVIFTLAAFCLLCFHYRQANNINLNDNSWKEGLHTNRTLMRDSDPLSLTYAGLRWTSNVFNCSVMSEIKDLELVGAGWTKAVYKGYWKGRTVAIKTVNLEGHDVVECSRKGFPVVSCYERAAAKILREIALLAELQHKNIIKVLGTCVPEMKGTLLEGVSVITEYGDSIDTIKLLQMSFAQRLKLALDVAEILHHLAHSPLGSLEMLDFRKQQFVLVDSILKLSDVDDIGVPNYHCYSDIKKELDVDLITSKFTKSYDYEEHLPSISKNVANYNPKLELRNCEKLQGFQNERNNIRKAGRIFITDVLVHGYPAHLRSYIEQLVLAYSNSDYRWNSSNILNFTKDLYQIYITRNSVK